MGSEFQVLLERGRDGKDYMTVKVERAEKADPEEDRTLAAKLEHQSATRSWSAGRWRSSTSRVCRGRRESRKECLIKDKKDCQAFSFQPSAIVFVIFELIAGSLTA